MNKICSHYSPRMKVLFLAPIFAMVAIGIVYGDDLSGAEIQKKDCNVARSIIEMEVACEEPVVTLFTSHYVVSIIQYVA